MGSRTWLPTLIYWLRVLCNYINRNERQIREHLTSDGNAALTALLVACAALEAAVSLSQGQ